MRQSFIFFVAAAKDTAVVCAIEGHGACVCSGGGVPFLLTTFGMAWVMSARRCTVTRCNFFEKHFSLFSLIFNGICIPVQVMLLC